MVLYYVCVALCLISGLSAKTLPDSIPRCYRNDPNLNDCFMKAAEILRPTLITTGIPALGVPGIEPYVVPSVTFEQDAKSLQFKMSLKNLTIGGLGTYKFTKASIDPETFTWNFTNTFSKLQTTSHCKFEGKILILPLSGQGTLRTTTLEPSEIQTSIKARLVKRKGVDYLEIVNIDVIAPLVKTKARFENFDNINQEILEAINTVIEENAEELASEVAGSIQGFMSSFVKTLYTNIFRKVPYDDLLPISNKLQ